MKTRIKKYISRNTIAIILATAMSFSVFAANSYAHSVYAAGSKAYSKLNTDSPVYGYVYIEVQDKNGNRLINNDNYGTSTSLTTSVNYASYSNHYRARGTFHATIDGIYKNGEKYCYT